MKEKFREGINPSTWENGSWVPSIPALLLVHMVCSWLFPNALDKFNIYLYFLLVSVVYGEYSFSIVMKRGFELELL